MVIEHSRVHPPAKPKGATAKRGTGARQPPGSRSTNLATFPAKGSVLDIDTLVGHLFSEMSERLGAEHYGEERGEAEEWKRRNWTGAELQTRPKGDAGKVALAAA